MLYYPVEEMIRLLRKQAHSPCRYIDAMGGISRIIGKALADMGPGLEYGDTVRRVRTMGQMIGHAAPVKPPPMMATRRPA